MIQGISLIFNNGAAMGIFERKRKEYFDRSPLGQIDEFFITGLENDRRKRFYGTLEAETLEDGSIQYKTGKGGVIVDVGPKIVLKQIDEETVRAAIVLARIKFSSELEFHGPKKFVKIAQKIMAEEIEKEKKADILKGPSVDHPSKIQVSDAVVKAEVFLDSKMLEMTQNFGDLKGGNVSLAPTLDPDKNNQHPSDEIISQVPTPDAQVDIPAQARGSSLSLDLNIVSDESVRTAVDIALKELKGKIIFSGPSNIVQKANAIMQEKDKIHRSAEPQQTHTPPRNEIDGTSISPKNDGIELSQEHLSLTEDYSFFTDETLSDPLPKDQKLDNYVETFQSMDENSISKSEFNFHDETRALDYENNVLANSNQHSQNVEENELLSSEDLGEDQNGLQLPLEPNNDAFLIESLQDRIDGHYFTDDDQDLSLNSFEDDYSLFEPAEDEDLNEPEMTNYLSKSGKPLSTVKSISDYLLQISGELKNPSNSIVSELKCNRLANGTIVYTTAHNTTITDAGSTLIVNSSDIRTITEAIKLSSLKFHEPNFSGPKEIVDIALKEQEFAQSNRNDNKLNLDHKKNAQGLQI
ncbi:MAG: hypothetical protein EOO46_10050 [Flavobacterium sp.]|nr:MAG: hypothetical protein EOO46_10050 [Flavobacterium sp.]